jgi:hypothetical protein
MLKVTHILGDPVALHKFASCGGESAKAASDRRI